MAYFTSAFSTFFQDLARNNHREWFQENKKTYEQEVKKPFARLVTDLIDRIHADDPEIMLDTKDAIFRINRDIRFSKDKTPYKNNVSAVITPGGRKDVSTPGFYFELKADEIGVYGGLYQLDKEQLLRVRTHLAETPDELESLLSDPVFHKEYGTLLGDQHKRLPAEFKEAAIRQPLIANKAFYYHTQLPGKLLTSDKLLDVLMEKYFIAKPMKTYLMRAVRG